MNIATNWQASHCVPPCSLGASQVHVWRISLNPAPLPLASFRTYLSPDEAARADQFKHDSAQEQFVVTRSLLRQLLGWYAGMAPSDIQLKKTSEGKPYPVFPEPMDLRCNVSHTKGMAIVAISGGDSIGIDVESVDRRVNTEELAKRFFSRREACRLGEVEPNQRIRWFLTYWTCKEAFLKMQGLGLHADISKYEIELEVGSQTASIAGLPPSNTQMPYTLWRMNPGKIFIGAVAVESHSPEISFFDWSPKMIGHDSHL